MFEFDPIRGPGERSPGAGASLCGKDGTGAVKACVDLLRKDTRSDMQSIVDQFAQYSGLACLADSQSPRRACRRGLPPLVRTHQGRLRNALEIGEG